MNTNASPSAQVTVYSKPGCMQCTMTKKALEKNGIPYTEVDVTEVEAALEYISIELSYAQVPVVVVDDQTHWAGFRPDRIGRLGSLGATA